MKTVKPLVVLTVLCLVLTVAPRSWGRSTATKSSAQEPYLKSYTGRPYYFHEIDSVNTPSPKGNPGYDTSNYFVLGLATVYMHYPSRFQLAPLTQKGFMIGSSYNATNIDGIDFGNQLRISFNVGNQSSVGFASASNYTKYPDNSIDTVHYYTGFASLFSYNINAEAALRLPTLGAANRRIIGGIALTLTSAEMSPI